MLFAALKQRESQVARGVFRQARKSCAAPGITLTATASIISWFVVTQLKPVIQDQSPHSSIQTSSVKLSQSASPATMPQISQMRKEAFYGMFVADALSMPVHWYYDTDDIKRDFDGWLTGYVRPQKKHPSSILTISAIGGAGRSTFSGKQKNIIGDVILHDKLEYWTKKDRTVHYHQGMAAGDNTLNAQCAVMAAIQASKDPEASEDAVLKAIMTDYVRFMTTPGTHNDTYAESMHREFFRDWDNKGRPTQPDEVMKFVNDRVKDLENQQLDHNIDGIGSLVHPIPVVIHYADRPVDVAAKQAVRLTRMTHASVNLDPFVDVYARTLHGVMNGASLKEKVREALTTPPIGNVRTMKMIEEFSRRASKYPKGSEERLAVYQSAVGQLGLACYIKGAMTSLLFLAHEFHDDFEGGVLTNTNCGGENCNRGAALGALLGAEAARIGKPIPEKYKTGLNSLKSAIDSVLDSWPGGSLK